MGEKDAALKQALKEMNRLKSNCSAKSRYMHSPWYAVSRFSFVMAMPVHRINARKPCLKPLKRIMRFMRYTKSLTPDPTVAIVAINDECL